jgi:glycerophosphoryl diester phosphodiesterase
MSLLAAHPEQQEKALSLHSSMLQFLSMAPSFFDKRTIVLAHRGDSVRFPENTMPAFKSAAEMGVDVIETDVHLSKDGKVVIWHDEDLSRTAGHMALIREMTWPELQKIDAGYNFSADNGKTFPFRGKGVKIALFQELLHQLPEMRFNVDLKADDPALVEGFAFIIEQENALDRVIGASFHHRILKRLRRRLPGLVTSFSPAEMKGILVRKMLGILRFCRKMPGAVMQIPEYFGKLRVVSPGLIRQAHQAGLKIQVWTVNERPEMIRLLSMGVDGIFTDNPEVLLSVTRKT